MVACTHTDFASVAWRFNYTDSGLCISSIYLCNILSMPDKIKIEKKKKRVPVPKKPPKVEENKDTYNRNKEKEKLRKEDL